MTEPSRKCNTCFKEKEEHEFFSKKTNRYIKHCSNCSIIYVKSRMKYKEDISKKQQIYYTENKEKILKYQKERYKKKETFVHCDICNKDVLFIKEHNKSKSHYNKANNIQKPKKEVIKHHCKSCDKYIVDIKNHNKTKKHLNQEKLREKLHEHNPVVKERHNCKICNKMVCNLNRHNLTTKHLNLLENSESVKNEQISV
jgi:hypothetical protein